MKKIHFTLLMTIVALLSLQSCSSDDSSYGTDKTNIQISGIESRYSVTSFAGRYLEINPQITSSFADDDLEYSWAYYDPTVQTIGPSEKAKVISTDRNLKYEVNMLDGNYKFYLTVTSKSTGYGQQSQLFDVTVSSALSKGFYIIKENGNGDTDIDFYSTMEETLISNVLSEKSDGAIKGKPRSLDIIPNMCYINPDDGEKASGTCVSITTDDDKARWYRILDMKKVMDETNCTYDGYVAGRKPYRTVYSSYSGHYLSSSAVFTSYLSSVMLSIGKFATIGDNGSSTHVIRNGNNMYFVTWNEGEQRFGEIDYNGSYFPVNGTDGTPMVRLDNVECLSSGMCLAGSGTGYFIMQDKNDSAKRWIYYIEFDPSTSMASIAKIKEVEAGSHLAKSSVTAVNCLQSTVVYNIDGNKLYSYDLNGIVAEKELPLAGLAADETVTYIANRFLKANDSWDRLFVGTQKGNTYKIYIYDVVGGEPVGQPVKTISGSGKLRKIDYADPEITKAGQTPLLDD